MQNAHSSIVIASAVYFMTCHTKIQNLKSFLILDQSQCHIFFDVISVCQFFISQKHQSNHDILQIQKNMNQYMILIQEFF